MRKTLICYEYAIQATRCRMAKYPGNAAPSSEHLEILDDVLVNHRCQVRVEMKSGEPLIDIQLMSGQSHELDKVFELLQSEPSISSRVETPAPTIPLSSVDMDDSIFDDRSSEFSDEGSLDFHYDDMRAMEAGTYRTLSIPDRCFLPIRIVRLLEDTRAVIQPARYSSNDSPAVWQEQVDGFARLDIELQRSAPRLQDIEVVDHGKKIKSASKVVGLLPKMSLQAVRAVASIRWTGAGTAGSSRDLLTIRCVVFASNWSIST